MRIKIYQINQDRDDLRVKSCDLEETQKIQQSKGRSMSIDPKLYDEVFDGEVNCKSLWEVYSLFNTDHPAFYRGHNLSKSDVVQVDGYSPEFTGVDFWEDMIFTDKNKYDEAAKETVDEFDILVTSEILRHIKPPENCSGFYFCDQYVFEKIEFDPTLTQKPDNLLRVVAVEPGKPAYKAEVADELLAFRQAVRGEIEVTNPFDDNTVVVSNRESKNLGMDSNRTINGEVYAGTLFIIGDNGDGTFCSLTDEQAMQYLAEFNQPEFFGDEDIASRESEDENMDSGIQMT